jgi:hypothetical protein
MATIKLTRSDSYAETGGTITIKGSNLKNRYLFVEYSDSKHTVGSSGQAFSTRIATVKITNDTSFTYTYTPSQTNLNSVYNNLPNTNALRINIFISTSYTVAPTTNTSYYTYIKPELPTFDIIPSYEETHQTNLEFSNDNQMIINGSAKLRFSNIQGTSYKNATIVSMNISGNKFAYNSTHFMTLPYMSDPELYIQLIDSRGFISEKLVLADASKFLYRNPCIIKDYEVKRDGISEQTLLSTSGYYSEGYNIGAASLTCDYKYAEIIGSSTPTYIDGTTSLTLTKTPTQEWQDYLTILGEYNNPHYFAPQNQNEYYEKALFESDIQDIFETAISYNNKYTQEYLQQDYDSVTQRYYCISGGYNGLWKNFWLDTLKTIQKAIYGENGIGGNYKFEIDETSIKGDAIEGGVNKGFSIDKTFYIQFNIASIMYERTQSSWYLEKISRTNVLPTAIPAIDIFKDKVSLHGLYDENISDSDIQLWGNTFLNGYNLQNISSLGNSQGVIQLGKIGIEWGVTTISISSTSSSSVFGGTSSIIFNNTYANAPHVSTDWYDSFLNDVNTYVISRTTTGCTIGCHTSSSSSSSRTIGYFVFGVLEDN